MAKVILTNKDFTFSQGRNVYSMTEKQAEAVANKIKNASVVEINFSTESGFSWDSVSPSWSKEFWSQIDLTGKKLIINTEGYTNFSLTYPDNSWAWVHEAKINADEIEINMHHNEKDTFFSMTQYTKLPNCKKISIKASDYKLELDNQYKAFDSLKNISVDVIKPKQEKDLMHSCAIVSKNAKQALNVDVSNAPLFFQHKNYRYPDGMIYSDTFALDFSTSPKTKITFSSDTIIAIDPKDWNISPEEIGLPKEQYGDYIRWLTSKDNFKVSIGELLSHKNNVPPSVYEKQKVTLSWSEYEDLMKDYATTKIKANVPAYINSIEEAKLIANQKAIEKRNAFFKAIKQYNSAQQVYLRALFELDSDEYLTSQYVPHTVKRILESEPEDFKNIKTLKDVEKIIEKYYTARRQKAVDDWSDVHDGSCGLEIANVESAKKQLKDMIASIEKENKHHKAK